jgi:hypothetical protein
VLSAPERIGVDLDANTALVEIKRKSREANSWYGQSDSCCLRGNMYNEDGDDGGERSCFYPHMTPKRALQVFVKDILASASMLFGAAASLAC